MVTSLIAYSLLLPFLEAPFMLVYCGFVFSSEGWAKQSAGLGLSPCSQSLFQCLSLAWSQTDLKQQIKTGQLKLLLLPARLLFFLANITPVGAVLMVTVAAAPCGFPGYLHKPSKPPGSDHVSMELASGSICRIW